MESCRSTHAAPGREVSESTSFAFVVASADNVATLLVDASAGVEIQLLGESNGREGPVTRQAIAAAHKVALCRLEVNDAIVKYGHRIGHATQTIAAGDWVHLHNCASDVDERSNTLDVHTGAPGDTHAAYE